MPNAGAASGAKPNWGGIPHRWWKREGQLGYRPDPVIGRLMHQLRQGGHPGLRASLCAVTDFPIGDEPGSCERPEIVIVGHSPDLPRFQDELQRAGLDVGWALANSRPFVSGEAGLDEHHDLIGAAAIDSLVSLVTRGERGVPRVATTVSIEGEWSDAKATLG